MMTFLSYFRMVSLGLLLMAGLPLACGSEPCARRTAWQCWAGLAKGEWTIKHRDGSPGRKICVRSGQELIQIKPTARQDATSLVVETACPGVTVQYTCPGNGYRTHQHSRENRDTRADGNAGHPFRIAPLSSFRLRRAAAARG